MVAELLHRKHQSDMTWDAAEVLYPGCSAQWDVTSSKFTGDWEVVDLFVNCRDGLTLLVRSTNPDCFRVGRRQYAAYFTYGPGNLWWMMC